MLLLTKWDSLNTIVPHFYVTTKKRRGGDVLAWHDTPTLLWSPYGPSPERKSYQGGVYVCFLWRECVWAQQRPVHQSGNRGHINLICHNLSLETLGPPCPNTHPATRTHTQTLTPSCVLSVSATDRESEANYMWELRRWKRDKDRAGVCACAYVAFVWVLIYFTCPCCCYVWVTQITVTCH